jgi:hypothetical protein
MKTNQKNIQNNSDKPSQNIGNNPLFTDITVQEEVFVRGGLVGIPERLSKEVTC